jgi:SPP1 family predicted phage head-tail adaptor
MRTIQPADLTERITFQVRATTRDALGQASGAWANVATDPTVWARPGFIGGRDVAIAGQHQATLDAKFIIRKRADILPTWRVLWGGKPFEIIGQPIPLGQFSEWLQINCTAGVRDGRD